jgi:hypothetical protein
LNSVYYEHDVFKLHNTSKCIDWLLPEDTTKITFTIDRTRYENILLSDIDFDGSTCGVQQDFIDGLQAMFENLNGESSSSSSYLVYTAHLTQSSTDAPVATEFGTQTIGGTITFARTQMGRYTPLYNGGAFPAPVMVILGFGGPEGLFAVNSNTTTPIIYTFDLTDNAADGFLYETPIQILLPV